MKIASLFLVAPIGLLTGVAAAALVWNGMQPKPKRLPMGAGADAPLATVTGQWNLGGHWVNVSATTNHLGGTDVLCTYDNQPLSTITYNDYNVLKQGLQGLAPRIFQTVAEIVSSPSFEAGADDAPSNMIVGPDSTTGVWKMAGHTISIAVLRSDAPGVTDVFAAYDQLQLPKMVIQADYDVAKKGIEGLKARILQAMAVGVAAPVAGYGYERPPAPRGLRWRDDGLPGDVLESECGYETTPLSRRFARLYARRPDLRPFARGY
jgi:hypothetical protein